MNAVIIVAFLCLFAQAIVGQEDPLTVNAPSPSFAYSGEAVGTFVGDITVKTTPTGVPSILATILPSPEQTTVAPSIVPSPAITIVPSPLITFAPSPSIQVTIAPLKKTATVVAITSSAASLQSFLSFLF